MAPPQSPAWLAYWPNASNWASFSERLSPTAMPDVLATAERECFATSTVI